MKPLVVMYFLSFQQGRVLVVPDSLRWGLLAECGNNEMWQIANDTVSQRG